MRLYTVPDLGIHRRGGATGGVDAPHIGGLGLCPQRGCKGQSPGWGGLGSEAPRSRSLKILYKRPRKRSGDVNVKCIVDNPLLIFAPIFVFTKLQHVCANLLSVVSLIRPTHVSKIIYYCPRSSDRRQAEHRNGKKERTQINCMCVQKNAS